MEGSANGSATFNPKAAAVGRAETGLSRLSGLSRSFGWLIGKPKKPERPDELNKPEKPDRPAPIPKKERALVGGWDGRPGRSRMVHGQATPPVRPAKTRTLR